MGPQIEPTDKPWSWTHLDGMASCPKRLYHTRVKKDVTEPPGVALIHGNEVHAALDHYLKGVSKTFPLGMRHLERFAKAVQSIPGHLQSELQLALSLRGEPTAYFGKTVWWRSVVDVNITKRNKAWIIDWKTGKRRMNDDQLTLMAAMVMEQEPSIDWIKASFVWVADESADPDSVVIERKDRGKIWDRFNPRIRALQTAFKSTDFPPKPGYLCKRWCPVTACSFYRR